MKRATQVYVCLHMCERNLQQKICGKTKVCEMYSYKTFCFATDTSKKLRWIIICPPTGFSEDFHDKNQKSGNRLCNAA